MTKPTPTTHLTDVAVLTRYTIPNGVLQYSEGEKRTVVKLDKMSLYVPEGTEFTTRDLNEGERDAFEKLKLMGDIDFMPTAQVYSPIGVYYIPGKGGVPRPERFHEGIGIYVEDASKVTSEQDTTHPLDWAELLFNGDAGRPPVALKSIEAEVPIGVEIGCMRMAKALLEDMVQDHADSDTASDYDRNVYGSGMIVHHHEDTEEEGYAMVQSVMFKDGTSAMMTRGDGTLALRIYRPGELYLMSEPGTSFERRELTDEEAATYLKGFENPPSFKPAEIITVRNAAFFDGDSAKASGDAAALVVGDFHIAVEKGTTVQLARAWGPKEAFVEMGYTNFIEERNEPFPTKEEQQAALAAVQSEVTV